MQGLNEKLYLILGCFGRIDDNFISCSSCENVILHIHPGLDNYDDIMDYLDVCRLFDKPAFDFNTIRHVLQNLQGRFDQVSLGRKLWSEKQVELYQRFIIEHKSCGLYLKLQLTQQEKQIKTFKEKFIKIKASSKKNKIIPKKIKIKKKRVKNDRN